MKTARFSQLVSAAGKPTQHLLLVPPEKDLHLLRAQKEHRVLSVQRQVRGTKADSGQVGIFRDEHTQFLVFPHSIGKYRDRKIVGIDFDQVEEPESGPAPEVKQPERHTVDILTAEEQGAGPKEKEERNTKAPPSPQKTRSAREPRPRGKASGAAEPRRGFGSAKVGASTYLRAIRKAQRELEKNNAVAAYKTLQEAAKLGA